MQILIGLLNNISFNAGINLWSPPAMLCLICHFQVAARILDRKYEVYGKDVSTSVKMDSDIYNPIYESRTEFRESQLAPSATLLFKVIVIK